jgi:hypothetical protein
MMRNVPPLPAEGRSGRARSATATQWWDVLYEDVLHEDALCAITSRFRSSQHLHAAARSSQALTPKANAIRFGPGDPRG